MGRRPQVCKPSAEFISWNALDLGGADGPRGFEHFSQSTVGFLRAASSRPPLLRQGRTTLKSSARTPQSILPESLPLFGRKETMKRT